MEKVNLDDKFSLFDELWSPRLVGRVNDTAIKLARLKGEFLWHSHDSEDEMFFVHKGVLTIRFRDRDVELSPGEFLVIPRGVEHMPVAREEVQVMLVEPASTLNTGNVRNERTRETLGKI